MRRQIKSWLKAGVIDNKQLFPTEEGTPQGGVLSPLLANVALHGLEELVQNLTPTLDIRYSNGKRMSVRDKKNSISLIRYADDFVCLHENIEVILQIKEEIEKWLKGIGLELKPSKTRIAHTLNTYKDEKAGFNFLGFNIRQHHVGKYTSGKSSNGNLLGFKTIITPSNESQIKHYRELKKIINTYKGVSQSVLIQQLNPVIEGWCNYFSSGISKKIFSKLTYILKYKLIKWGIKRHRNKSKKWVIQRYFKTIGDNNWVFTTGEGKNPISLIEHVSIEIKRHVKVKGNASPFDGDLIYWSKRLGKHPEMPKNVATLLKKQKGKIVIVDTFAKMKT